MFISFDRSDYFTDDDDDDDDGSVQLLLSQ